MGDRKSDIILLVFQPSGSMLTLCWWFADAQCLAARERKKMMMALAVMVATTATATANNNSDITNDDNSH